MKVILAEISEAQPSQLTRGEVPFIRETTRIYLRDVQDHLIRVVEMIELYRDLVLGERKEKEDKEEVRKEIAAERKPKAEKKNSVICPSNVK